MPKDCLARILSCMFQKIHVVFTDEVLKYVQSAIVFLFRFTSQFTTVQNTRKYNPFVKLGKRCGIEVFTYFESKIRLLNFSACFCCSFGWVKLSLPTSRRTPRWLNDFEILMGSWPTFKEKELLLMPVREKYRTLDLLAES